MFTNTDSRLRTPFFRGLVALLFLMGSLGCLWTGSVNNAVRSEDLHAMIQFGILKPHEIAAANRWGSMQQQTALMELVRRVHSTVTKFEGIENGQDREPLDVLQRSSGVCFDRARVIEKAATAMGFETRRVFLVYGGWSQLLKPGGPTHTLVEVKWQGVWVFLGTLTPVTGFAKDGHAWSVSDLRILASTDPLRLRTFGWKEILPRDFLPVVGLYSRHGQHYPPFTPVPDFSPGQMMGSWMP